MFDLHLHSTASDGDFAPADVVREAAKRGLGGVSLTDHNGVWGLEEAAAAAQELELEFVEGIEVTARFNDADVHVLGYSRRFNREVLEEGLVGTRSGYEERTRKMVELCQAAGYDKVDWEAVQARRAHLKNPSFVSFDVVIELMEKYDLLFPAARLMTVKGGVCHVPYGDWALTPEAAVELLHKASGAAVLAHPGIIAHEGSQDILVEILGQLMAAGLNGIEVYHPFHDEEFIAWLQSYLAQHSLAFTGGSDWHGPHHFEDNEARFGSIGVEADDVALLLPAT